MGDILPEKWMKGVAVTATVLAVLTAIASSRGTAFAAKLQLLTSIEASQWSYYQAKSIKQNLMESEEDLVKGSVLGAANAEQKNYFESRLGVLAEEIARYDKEKKEIRTQAEATGAENKLLSRKATQVSYSVVLFQIAIMLSSVSALVKRKEMWAAGIVFGLIACVFLANGLLLFF